jgi:hypothetical protein
LVAGEHLSFEDIFEGKLLLDKVEELFLEDAIMVVELEECFEVADEELSATELISNTDFVEHDCCDLRHELRETDEADDDCDEWLDSMVLNEHDRSRLRLLSAGCNFCNSNALRLLWRLISRCRSRICCSSLPFSICNGLLSFAHTETELSPQTSKIVSSI